MLEALKQRVYEQNLLLVRHGLVVLTWGNVSAVDRSAGLIVIKPSGLRYEEMKPGDMVVTDLSGKVVEGAYRPSSDTPTHCVLYRAFPSAGGIVHTHSAYAVAWAQAGRDLPAYGTTHADAFCGDVPCTRALRAEELASDYERHTGEVIEETLRGRDGEAVPACLVRQHGPFVWGPTPEKAVENAVTLESAAKMALLTAALEPDAPRIDPQLLDKHYSRKHGDSAYYGQIK